VACAINKYNFVCALNTVYVGPQRLHRRIGWQDGRWRWSRSRLQTKQH
jgi:hypothetical protein